MVGAMAQKSRAPTKEDFVANPTARVSSGGVVLGAVAQQSRAPTKADSVATPSSSVVGAVQSSVSVTSASTSISRSGLSRMEADVAAKIQAAGGRSTSGPTQTILGASASAGPLPSLMTGCTVAPSMMFVPPGTTNAIDRKIQENNPAVVKGLTSLANDVAAKIQAASNNNIYGSEKNNSSLQDETTLQERMVSENDSTLRTLESDMAAKSQSRNLGANVQILNPATDDYDNKVKQLTTEQNQHQPLEQPSEINPYQGGKDVPEKWYDESGNDGSGNNDLNLPQNNAMPDVHGDYNDGAAVGLMPNDDGALMTPLTAQGDAFEAYVADKKVFEATGILALPGKEEEEREEKKKLRKYMLYGVLALLLIAAVIIVPIAVVFGKPKTTEAPSAAPTVVESMAPSHYRMGDAVEFIAKELYDNNMDFFDSENRESPQYLAADWIANVDPMYQKIWGWPEINTTQFLQRYILAVFYFSTGGDTWKNCKRNDPRCTTGFGWMQEKGSGGRNGRDECKWMGIRCDIPGKITRILIGESAPLGNNLVGTIPSELGQLSLLSSITLVGGIFSGGKLRGTIPSELGLLTNLKSVYIQAHRLTGTIPEELTQNKTNLEMFAITRNRLIGTLPTNLVDSPKLQNLQFHGNRMNGTIPELYGQFTRLDNLELNQNQFTGTIPNKFYDLPLLVQLSLNNNDLRGSISTHISQLTDIRIIEMGDNQLTGTIPSTLYTMPNLAVVRIAGNELTGTLSEDIAMLNETLQIFIAHSNNLTGTFPLEAFESIPALRELELHNTKLVGNVSAALCESRTMRNLTVPKTVTCENKCCDIQA